MNVDLLLIERYITKIKIEIVVREDMVELCIDTIIKSGGSQFIYSSGIASNTVLTESSFPETACSTRFS